MKIDVDAAVARIAESHHGVFAFHHLQQLKVSEDDRCLRLESGRWESPYQLVYRIAGAPRSWKTELLAACWAGGERAFASHQSAAALWDLPGQRRAVAEITCPRWRRARHLGLLVHETTALSSRDTTIVDGIPVTTVARTIFDLGAVSRRFTVDQAIDTALRNELTTLDELYAVLRRVGKRGRKGTKQLRGLLAERDADYAPTESEREQMLIRVLLAHGLPEPERQFSIYDDLGEFVARPDLVYRDLKIAMEYDSYQHHVGKDALVRDSRRRNAMTAIGWITLVATAEDLNRGNGHKFVSDVSKTRAIRQLASATGK
jgi:predicted transcriptional regulator of viral defense system/very-short-patch-repair endonuclease